MFSISGKCKSKDGKVVACSLLTSTGQNGGGITFTDSGKLFAIYTEIVDNKTNGEKLGYGVRMTQGVVDWVEDLGE